MAEFHCDQGRKSSPSEERSEPSPSTEDLIERIEDDGNFEWREYSGRAMFGKVCIGVDLANESELWRLAKILMNYPAPRIDDMGRGIIAYWPRYEIKDNQNEKV